MIRFVYKPAFMSTQLHHQVQDLISRIKTSSSESQLLKLLQKISTENDLIFLKELRFHLSQIDPISVGDSKEWTMIQAGRVYLHRIMGQKERSKA